MAIPSKNPELMVVGDSLAQGCRSLSVTDTFCSQSYSSIIAQEQGWEFRAPTHPRPVVFDVEDIAKKTSLASFFINVGKIDRNLEAWLRDFKSDHSIGEADCFDNLAVAGLNLSELSSFTHANSKAEVLAKVPVAISGTLKEKFDLLSELHIRTNSAYVLNPSQKREYANWTQLDWVRKRRPKRLIVHCGHNDGLYTIGGSAEYTDIRLSTWPRYSQLLDELAALPKEIGTIVVVSLPRLSSVGNLNPVGAIDADGYAQKYRTEFPVRGLEISRQDIRKADEDVKWLNAEIRKKIQRVDDLDRFKVIDGYLFMKKFDYKNLGGIDRQIKIKNKVIDNRYLKGDEITRIRRRGPHRTEYQRSYKFEHGGFFSLDGMHPSAIGYALIAIEIMRELGLSYNKERILETALKHENLVSHYSRGFYSFDRVLTLLDFVLPDGDDEKVNVGSACSAINFTK